MSKTEYREDWKLHNFGNDQIQREATLPHDLDKDLFDEDQLEYLTEYMADYRLEVIRIILNWITNIQANGKSKKNLEALYARIASRAVILDSILNKRDFKVLEMKSLFGISTHQYYDELNRVMAELNSKNKNIENILKRN